VVATVAAVLVVPAEKAMGERGANSVGKPRDRTRQIRGNPDRVQRLTGQADCAAGQEERCVRRLLTLEHPGCRQLTTLRRHVQHSGEDVASGDAVDRGMMDLGVDRGAPTMQPGDEVELPQRAAPVQRPGVQPGNLLGQLLVVAGSRKRLSLPGAGSASSLTWNSMSKSGSSIQYGWSSPSGTVTSRRRNSGTSGSRDSMTRVRWCRVMRERALLASTMQTLPTCPNTVRVSIARNAPSSPLS